jgi:hypothetical protein
LFVASKITKFYIVPQDINVSLNPQGANIWIILNGKYVTIETGKHFEFTDWD